MTEDKKVTDIPALVFYLVLVCSLLASFLLTWNYRNEVKALRHELAVSCQQRLVTHNALRLSSAAAITYNRDLLQIANENYPNQVKIITSTYPAGTQAEAIHRLNTTERALRRYLAKQIVAFNAGATFNCAS